MTQESTIRYCALHRCSHMDSLPTSLQEFILQKLSSLSLASDESNADFIEGIINEDSFEPEDKRSAILSILELDEGDGKLFERKESLLFFILILLTLIFAL